MTTNNPDVLHPTRGSQAHEERLHAQALTEKVVRDLLKAYGGLPLPKKDVVDAIAFELGCSQETAQGYLDALCSIHPRAPFVSHEINRKTHISLKDTQLLNEDANLSASQQDSKQPPKKRRPPSPKTKTQEGGGNA